jgi:exopolyphosphatase/guanosine-5'-triphosphate,3'-diphosphate pyrophosphatase
MDIGTNSVRLLLAETSKNQVRPLRREWIPARLGQGMGHMILPEAARRTLDALKQFSQIISRYKSPRIRLVGTQFLREAVNAQAFKTQIFQELGWELEIISGLCEARLSYMGATTFMKVSGIPVVLDIGGGSTEITLPDGHGGVVCASIPIGALRLYRHPMSSSDIQAYIREKWGTLSIPEGISLAGVAGTCTTLAAIQLQMEHYEAERINGLVMRRSQIEAILNRIMPMDSARRLEIPGIHAGREDILPYGIILLLEIMAFLQCDRLVIQDTDLLFGLIICDETPVCMEQDLDACR